MKKTLRVVAIMILITISYRVANSCSVSHVMTGKEICKESTYIVRATAKKCSQPGKISFEISEKLKGNEIPQVIEIEGSLNQKDDFNDREVPRNFVRPEGRHGSCVARVYKENAEFLLFLVEYNNNYTPYWAALAATNDQLVSTSDPWLVWVRAELNKKEQVSFKHLIFSTNNYFQVFLDINS